MHDAMSKFYQKVMTIYMAKSSLRHLLSISIGKRWAIIDALIPFYQELNLPMSLRQMGLYPEEAVLDAMVQFIDSKEKVHLIPIEISEERLRQGIEELKSISKPRIRRRNYGNVKCFTKFDNGALGGKNYVQMA